MSDLSMLPFLTPEGSSYVTVAVCVEAPAELILPTLIETLGPVVSGVGNLTSKLAVAGASRRLPLWASYTTCTWSTGIVMP
jgi:hypothetical protein